MNVMNFCRQHWFQIIISIAALSLAWAAWELVEVMTPRISF
jgi:hypothetical protein